MVFVVYPVWSWWDGTFTHVRQPGLTSSEYIAYYLWLVGHHELLDVLRRLPLIQKDHLLNTSTVHVETALLKV